MKFITIVFLSAFSLAAFATGENSSQDVTREPCAGNVSGQSGTKDTTSSPQQPQQPAGTPAVITR